ncbi:MAG: Integral rane sensor hybrid histidine kinase [Verrucomicrobia bacterium]|nr:Integral rane sensor hybrid histidine kinase [Verrucomicrobiota bacterium]
MNQQDVKTAFAEYDKKVRINNSRLGAIWAMILMPAGFTLDYLVYPDLVWEFFWLRILCSFSVWIVRASFNTQFGDRNYRVLGMIWYMLPAFFISGMIYASDDVTSPYYAGLNIVLIGAGLFLPWTYFENLLAWLFVTAMYAGAVLLIGTTHQFDLVFNNLYFLILTGLIVVVSSYYTGDTRYREFALRFELDRNKQTLEEANRKLTELDEVKTRFFANISHELRTPLTLLLAPIETMRRQKAHMFDDQTREWLVTMEANGLRLLKLINDLLDLVKLESGHMDVRRDSVNLTDFLKGLRSSVQKMADDKRVHLSAEVEAEVSSVVTDRDKLEKILLNLVFNAIKFTPSNGQVTIRAKKDGDFAQIEVIDTGMGIAAANIPYLFTRFWQADTSAQRKYQGTGIGLALVKELVEVQGGSVAVASKEGQGTTMTVRLPVTVGREEKTVPVSPKTPDTIPDAAVPTMDAPPAVVVAPPQGEWLHSLYRRAELFPSLTSLKDSIRPLQPTMGGNGQRPKVLVADDEPDMLRYLKSELVNEYEVIEAADGRQAIALAAQFQPDIILCDMMMPEMDGIQVCKELRARTLTQNIPVLLLTARADEDTKLNALSHGASDFLSKPFSVTELHVRLRNLTGAYLMQRKLARQNQVLEATLEQLKETLEQLKDTEMQLVQREKMASLGRMSAGIIHEINNPLNYAKTGLYTLRKKSKHIPTDEQEDFAEVLKDVEDGVNRVKDIVSDLRTFTHPREDKMDQLEISKPVTAALRFLSGEWKDKVTVHQNFNAQQIIMGNESTLLQLLTNLIQNALDALNSRKDQSIPPEIWIEDQLNENTYRLIVRDNGPGIPDEVISKIFDPFFTTKDVGQGMGLGLSICYRIMQQHGGRIQVRTEPGKFTEFTLEFPLKAVKNEALEAVS